MESMKRRFISFEGSEGCGKTTQIRLLKKRLEERGQKVIRVREPGSTPLGERLRRLLKHSDIGFCSLAELFLFEASRAELIKKIIEPEIAQNTWVLADRFTDSTLVYQGIVRGIPLKTIEELNQLATAGIKPTLTILLDIPVKSAQFRIKKRDGKKSGIDKLQADFESSLDTVRKAYLELASREPERFYVLEATGSPEEIATLVWEKINHVFEL
ncbi:dTMP kinase [Candidatus Methylacidiphilum fumarolicum]|uniref:Thymidylate kinase n=3 Tax=Candidatus Methylacidiphilum fumarolicum TaxID=591154 RepID=I0JZL5_METFB|nr:dTMP kinase [Candidatus Methylacidiphilum fumarolicum]TFE74169.1 dTMP kinase [Candidatus Methylacidiphilum fumarolicum]CAI9085236.1 Thymidylate kinase [Candidatus Methylacidiphilum fumarolicum]CCG92684.1 Thymidylate kinase [Methylacidiphilum fumariolicum SolV]